MKSLPAIFLAISMLFFAMCTSSCSTSTPQEKKETTITIQQKSWDEVMVIHDEVMPKMSELNKISKQLKEKSQVIRDEVLQPKIIMAIEALEKADEGMWSWMHGLQQLKALRQEKTHDEIMIYLSGQLTAIKKVKIDMEESTKNGMELLK